MMYDNEKNYELQENISRRLSQVMKNIKTKEITAKQLQRTMDSMKQNPKKKFGISHKSKKFFEGLWKENQKQ